VGLSERLFARWYPIVAGWSENAGQRETRAELVGRARGRTLELGAGNGYNLPHYPQAVTELVVSEPSPHMLALLRDHLAADAPPVGSWEVVATGAESLPFDDASFDTVVGVFVHCTIPDPAAALREIARVLRPGGQYLFLEHVRSPDSRLLARVQDVLERPHTVIAAGCHPNRRFPDLLAASPLQPDELVHGHMPRASPTVRPTLRGVALRPVP
jgi:ubiquinone/menaquinone biosynthesis C-methylase UbiE